MLALGFTALAALAALAWQLLDLAALTWGAPT